MMNREVYRVYDKDNDSYAISTNKNFAVADKDVACEIGCKSKQDYENYFYLLQLYDAFSLYKDTDYYGFKNKSDCQRCVDTINQAETIQELFKDIPVINNDIEESEVLNNTAIINISDFDNKASEVLKEMRKEYPSMTSGDLQTVSMFCKMFKEKYLN